jgi:hypothetical protein
VTDRDASAKDDDSGHLRLFFEQHPSLSGFYFESRIHPFLDDQRRRIAVCPRKNSVVPWMVPLLLFDAFVL